MSTGQFLNFYLSWAGLTNDQQAQAILDKAQTLINDGAIGVAITYSANSGQTETITQVYDSGQWYTDTDGLNQAAVMAAMENLEANPPYTTLQGKMRIAPITTMPGGPNAPYPWTNSEAMSIAITDLARIKSWIEAGWTVLGWQNQSTVNNPDHPYAIGGGVAATIMPADVSLTIQQTLMDYAKTYG